jgi:hypothetical protein
VAPAAADEASNAIREAGAGVGVDRRANGFTREIRNKVKFRPRVAARNTSCTRKPRRCNVGRLLSSSATFVWKRQASIARWERPNHASNSSTAGRASASHRHLHPAILASALDLTLLNRTLMLQPCITFCFRALGMREAHGKCLFHAASGERSLAAWMSSGTTPFILISRQVL